MGLIHDPETGRRRVVHALIFTAVYSRHMFVWLTFGPTLEAIVAGCEAAWRFFGGVFQLGGVQAGDGEQLRRPADPDRRRQCRLTADIEVPAPRSRADQRHRGPPRMPRVAITFGCSRTTLRESTAEVLSRAVSARLPSGCQVVRSGLRSLSRTIDLRFGWARRIARRATRRCLGLSAHTSGCAASQR